MDSAKADSDALLLRAEAESKALEMKAQAEANAIIMKVALFPFPSLSSPPSPPLPLLFKAELVG